MRGKYAERALDRQSGAQFKVGSESATLERTPIERALHADSLALVYNDRPRSTMKALLLLSIGLLLAPLPRQADVAPAARGALLRTSGAFFALSVGDLDASAAWYAERLGLAVVLRSPPGSDPAVVVLEGGGLIVELVHHRDARGAPETSAGAGRDLVHGYFKAGAIVANFDKTVSVLRERGVEIAFGPFPQQADQRANVIVRDNAGNLIQLFGAP